MRVILFCLVMFIVSFFGTSVAFAQVPPEAGVSDLVKPVFDAVMQGHFALAGALLLILTVAVLRKYGIKKWPFFATDTGGTLLALVASFGGALATTLGAGVSLSWGVLASALGVAATASGGYTLIKRLAIPMLKMLPKSLQKPLSLIYWIFESPKIAEAEEAGKKAVAEKPSNGLGSPNELP